MICTGKFKSTTTKTAWPSRPQKRFNGNLLSCNTLSSFARTAINGNMSSYIVYLGKKNRTKAIKSYFWPNNLAKNGKCNNNYYSILFVTLKTVYKKKIQQS